MFLWPKSQKCCLGNCLTRRWQSQRSSKRGWAWRPAGSAGAEFSEGAAAAGAWRGSRTAEPQAHPRPCSAAVFWWTHTASLLCCIWLLRRRSGSHRPAEWHVPRAAGHATRSVAPRPSSGFSCLGRMDLSSWVSWGGVNAVQRVCKEWSWFPPGVGREREAWGFPQLTLKFPPWSVCVYLWGN